MLTSSGHKNLLVVSIHGHNVASNNSIEMASRIDRCWVPKNWIPTSDAYGFHTDGSQKYGFSYQKEKDWQKVDQMMLLEAKHEYQILVIAT